MQIINQNGKLLVDSRDVAVMVDREHNALMKSIRGYLQHLTQGGFTRSDFFIESTYEDVTGRTLPCFLLTKKGCHMVANKMTGEKGVLFTAVYVTKFEEMEESLRPAHFLPSTYKEALLQLVSQVEENEKLQTTNLVLEQKVNELQPKASYYDLILQNKSLLTVSQIAKDYGMGAPTLNKKLHELGVQYKQGGIWLLYAKHQDKGYTHTATYALDHTDSKPLTKWTQKGRLFIYDLLKQQGILPMIEREEGVIT